MDKDHITVMEVLEGVAALIVLVVCFFWVKDSWEKVPPLPKVTFTIATTTPTVDYTPPQVPCYSGKICKG